MEGASHNQHKIRLLGHCRSTRIRMGCTVARRIADILLQLFVLLVTGFLLLVLVDLRDRSGQKITASDSNPRRAEFPSPVSPAILRTAQGPELSTRQRRLARGSVRRPQVLQDASKPSGYRYCSEPPTKACRWRYLRTAIPLSSVGLAPIMPIATAHRLSAPPARHGYSFAAAVRGYSKAISWLARPAPLEEVCGLKVPLWRCPLTATPRLLADPSDDRTTGATWVFVRSGGVWSQQGDKLVGTGAHRASETGVPLGQGMSIALSADGDTAIVGGWRAEGSWVFTRSGGIWSQQGKKLVGSGALGSARQGTSVALSADGNTAIVGGWSDHDGTGAAWVFARSRGIWSQQGKKLVGSGAVGGARQGTSVALSADGNTALIGGPNDNPWDRSVPFGLGPAGAAWVFTRTDGIWSQQGEKLVSTGAARQGISVALSADGNVAIAGGLASDGGWQRHRCLPAAAGSGRKARRSSAPALWESPHLPLRCPPMAELFCSEGLTTMEV